MFKTTNDIKNYIHHADVEKMPIDYENKISANIFGNEILLENDPWMWHLHLKITNNCNCKCEFCVEQNSVCDENANYYINQVDLMLSEMEKNDILFSVSVTGGEPLLFKKFDDLCEVLKKHNIQFLTLNTNATYLLDKIDKIEGLFDFIDISRHSIEEEINYSIFKSKTPSISELKEIKKKLTKSKMRIQCVICDFTSFQNMLDFIETFKFADNISFRKLMKLSNEHGVVYDDKENIYYKLLDYAKANFVFKEQTIQDYYVYEIWNFKGIDLTFSYADMKMLYEVEKNEAENIIREFIVHPNGIISGSWDGINKVLLR